eukprot:1179088-Prorocentrum_minimum.AAC.1
MLVARHARASIAQTSGRNIRGGVLRIVVLTYEGEGALTSIARGTSFALMLRRRFLNMWIHIIVLIIARSCSLPLFLLRKWHGRATSCIGSQESLGFHFQSLALAGWGTPQCALVTSARGRECGPVGSWNRCLFTEESDPSPQFMLFIQHPRIALTDATTEHRQHRSFSSRLSKKRREQQSAQSVGRALAKRFATRVVA